MTYSVGWNMPGYLPDIDPVIFAKIDEARLYLSAELERFGRAEDDPPDFDDVERLNTFFEASKYLQENELTGDFAQTIGNYCYWIMESRS